MRKLIPVLFTLVAAPAFGQSELTVWRHAEIPVEEPAPTASEEVVPAAETPPGAEKLLATGTVPVIDFAHIVETVKVVHNAIEQLKRLEALRKAADIDLTRLGRIPFVDPENGTGAFLEKMLWILGGGHPIQEIVEEETLSYSTFDVAETFRRYFPGERIVAGEGEADGPTPWELWESEADYAAERYRAMLASLYRTMDIYTLHTQQVSRERRGIWGQRLEAPLAEGESQHAEMLLAALHQSLDAESVDRQLRMLASNTDLLLAAEALSERAAGLAKERELLDGRRELFSDWPRHAEASGKRLGF